MWTVGEEWNKNEARVPANFKKFALEQHKERWEWMTFPIHYVSYALSPHYHNENVFAIRKVMSGLREVLRFFAASPAEYNAALAEFANYKNMQDPMKFPTGDKGRIKIDMSPRKWWHLHGSDFGPLQGLALRIFSCGTSSSTSERNFR